MKPDASPAEIKRARRKRAEQVHPDKRGGSEQEMIAVNHAFDVLGDPARRQLYDSTGQDQLPPEQERVRGLVMQAFQGALIDDAPNILRHAQQFVDKTIADMKKAKADGERAKKSLKERRDKISVKGPVNAFHMIVDQQLNGIEQKLAALDNDIAMCEKAAEELKKYKTTEKLVQSFTATDLHGFKFDVTGSTGGSPWG